MSRKVAAVAGLVVVIAMAGALLAAMPKDSGNGWRLDRAAAWNEPPPESTHDPRAVVYGSDETAVGIGVTVYGNPTCPPELRGVALAEDQILVFVAERKGLFEWSCNLGAGPFQFGIVVERRRLPDLPFDVVVHDDNRPPTTIRIDSLPQP